MAQEAVGRRCSTCAFTFPLYYELCAICGSNLWSTYMDGPSDTWEEDLRWRLRAAGHDELWTPEAFDADKEWAAMVPHNYDNAAELYGWNDLLWVRHDDLLACDYLNLTEDKIVFINGEFYELQGYDMKSKAWWIEKVAIDASELTPELIIGYGEASEA